MNYKKTFRHSTGNPIVDEVGTMNFTGNVIPMVWFKTIRYPNGAPNNNAIHILADIVYWYRPKEERDEESGQLICMKKKFRGLSSKVCKFFFTPLSAALCGIGY